MNTATLPRRRSSSLRILSAWACCSATLLGAGCTVGPDYHKPKADVPTNYVNPSAPPTTQSNSVTVVAPVDIARWWETFNDPTLNSLIKRAIDGNLDLKQATARLRAARAQMGVVGAGQLPVFNADASYARNGYGNGNVTTGVSRLGHRYTTNNAYRTNTYLAGFDASWELDVFGGVRRNVESADASVTAAVEDRRDVLVSLIAEVAVDYIQLRGYQLQIKISQENLEAQQQTADVTRRKLGAGFVSRLDVANADAQVYSTQSDIPALESSAQQAIYAMSLLLGEEPGALLGELLTTRPVPPSPPEVPIGVPAGLLRRRPDIRRAEAQLHAATAQIGVATAQLYPQFNLLGSLDLEPAKIGGFGQWANNVWSVGPSMTWPIFAGGRILANIDLQNATQEQALLTYRQTVLGALRDVENALVAYGKEQQRRNILVEDVAANQDALALSTRLYKLGQTDFLNVLNAERSLFSAQTQLAQSNVNIATDLAALYKALGGGWDIDAPPATAPTTQLVEPP